MNVFWAVGPHALVRPKTILDPEAGGTPGRAQGIFLNAAVNGFVLIACAMAAFYLASQRRGRFRGFALLSGLFMLGALVPTQTRSVWLAAAAVLIVCAIFWRGFRPVFVGVLLVLGIVIGANWQTFTSSDRTQGGVTSAQEAEARLNIIATGVWAIEQKPVFGWGIGRFVNVNTIHHKGWGNAKWQHGYGLVSHETQIGIGAELGALGLGVWLLALISIGVVSRRAWRALPRSGIASRWLVLCFWCVGIAWLVTSSLIDMRFFAGANALFFVWAGIVAALADRATVRVTEPRPEVLQPPVLRQRPRVGTTAPGPA
jgi:O-antigen ligase